MAKYRIMKLEDRKKIEALYMKGLGAREIAEQVGFAPQNVYKELAKGQTGRTVVATMERPEYSAELSQKITDERLGCRPQNFVRGDRKKD